jgi:hypothetical protein
MKMLAFNFQFSLLRTNNLYTSQLKLEAKLEAKLASKLEAANLEAAKLKWP